MAKLIAEMVAERAGEVCCGVMIQRGYSPVHLKVFDEGRQVQIVLDVVAKEDGWGWVKGFHLQNGDIDPDLLQRDFEMWKMQMRQSLANGNPPDVCKEAIRRYGIEEVERALAPLAGLA